MVFKYNDGICDNILFYALVSVCTGILELFELY